VEESKRQAEDIIKIKSLQFAKRILKLYRHLCETKKEFVLAKQILRSGTSIGANVTEAKCAVSRREFLVKMQIAFKECVETLFWLELLESDSYITTNEYDSLNKDCEEIRKILSAITKSTKSKASKV